jgi:hypothetical protein
VFSLVGDDAGYYFHLARNDCLGFGFSFDRQALTNGFNPLCAWLLIGVFRLFGGGLGVETCYRLGVLLGLLAMLASLHAFARLVHEFLLESPLAPRARTVLAAAMLAFYALFVCTKSYYGMDAPFVLMLGGYYLLRVRRAGLLAPGLGATALDGALLALIFLARVDTLPLILTAFGLMAVSAPGRACAWRGTIGRSAVFLTVVAPYLAWSYAHFGTWLPISARIKSAFPHASVARSLDVIRHTSLNVADQASFLAAGLLGLFVCARVVATLRRGVRPHEVFAGREGVLGVLAVYLVLRFSYMLLFSRNDVQGSYAILAHVFNLLALLAGFDAWIARRRRPPHVGERYSAALAAGILLVGLAAFAGKLDVTRDRWRLMASGAGVDDATLGREIGAATRREDVLYGGAFGIAGYFADRAWINGDGVINTLDYQQRIRDGELAEYLAAHRVTHVVFTLAAPGVVTDSIRVEVPSGLFGARDAFVVEASDVILVRPTLRGRGGDVVLARYRR